MQVISEFNEFVVAADEYSQSRLPDWRIGQSAFNLLYRVRPDLAEMLRGSDFDPFYKNENLAAFYSFVMRQWDD